MAPAGRVVLWPVIAGGAGVMTAAVAAQHLRLGPGFLAASLLAYLLAGGIVARHFPPQGRFGPANAVTLLRVALVCLLAALLVAPAARIQIAWLTVWVVAGALLLDAVDGWAARRSGTASRFGARFDLETDAALVLVLTALAVAWGKVGPWVLAIGAMRYLFVLAGRIRPSLAAPLPDSLRRKAVCVLQVAVLAAVLAPPVGPGLAAPLAAGALAALVWSFAVDIAWLLRRAEPATPPAGTPTAP